MGKLNLNQEKIVEEYAPAVAFAITVACLFAAIAIGLFTKPWIGFAVLAVFALVAAAVIWRCMVSEVKARGRDE